MRARSLLGLIGGAGVVVVAAAHLRSASSESPVVTGHEVTTMTPSATRAAGDPGLDLEVQRLRGELRALQTAEPRSSESTADPDLDLTPQERITRDQAHVAQIERDLGERLHAERIDPQWAYDTERAIASTLETPSYAGLTLEDVTCGATMCRLALTANRELESVDGVVQDLTTKREFRHGGWVRYTSDKTLTMFIAREGHPLPPPPRT